MDVLDDPLFIRPLNYDPRIEVDEATAPSGTGFNLNKAILQARLASSETASGQFRGLGPYVP